MIRGSVLLMPSGVDLFTSGAEALVNPVDCTGAQGKGLALVFRQRWPGACAAYKVACRQGRIKPGILWMRYIHGGPWVLFVATKDNWRHKSRIDWVKNGLDEIVHFTTMRRDEHNIQSIAIPALGCGLGGLPWSEVHTLLLEAGERMANKGVQTLIYPPWEENSRSRMGEKKLAYPKGDS